MVGYSVEMFSQSECLLKNTLAVLCVKSQGARAASCPICRRPWPSSFKYSNKQWILLQLCENKTTKKNTKTS